MSKHFYNFKMSQLIMSWFPLTSPKRTAIHKSGSSLMVSRQVFIGYCPGGDRIWQLACQVVPELAQGKKRLPTQEYPEYLFVSVACFCTNHFHYIMEFFWHCLCFSEIIQDIMGISYFRIIFQSQGQSLVPDGKLVVFQMELSWSQILEVVARWHLTGVCHKPQPVRVLYSKLIALWVWALLLVPIQHVQFILQKGWIYMPSVLQYYCRQRKYSQTQYPSPQCIQVNKTQPLHLKFTQTFTLFLSNIAFLYPFNLARALGLHQ